MPTRFFRAGVGTVIYNEAGEVALFKRAVEPIGIWQFQQGGIDLGEVPTETLWRELKEEVGLTRENFETITERSGWTYYENINSLEDRSADRIGQIHHWFFLKLRGDTSIDLSLAAEREFSEFKWVSFDYAIENTGPNKSPVYAELKEYFETEVKGI